MGSEIHRPTQLEWSDDLFEIVYIDHYGNALTGVRGDRLASASMLVADSHHRLTYAETFAAVPPGQAFWYVNSNGLVEIAVNGGRADKVLGLTIGSPVVLAG